MSRKYWLKILIPLLIPAVNVILLLIWAFGSGNDPIRKNFSQVCLMIMVGIPIVVLLLSVILNSILTLIWFV